MARGLLWSFPDESGEETTNGVLVATLGSLVGTVLGLAAAYLLILRSLAPELDDLTPVRGAVQIGLPPVAGSVLGCYAALRARGMRLAGITANAVAALEIVGLSIVADPSLWFFAMPVLGIASPLIGRLLVASLE